MTSPPEWLMTVAWISLALGGISCLWILADIFLLGHRQHMWIMEAVWPITGLYAGPIALIAYYLVGRLGTREKVKQAKEDDEKPPNKTKPFWQITGIGVTHCGSGCALGDICAEWIMHLVTLGLLAGTAGVWIVFVTWGLDYVLALLFGIAFQYFSIVPMRNLSKGEGLKEAFKADFLSLTSWQIGMYGWMAIAIFALFGHHSEAMKKTSPVFWFVMQLAMFAGFVTAYPVNWWLIRKGIKEEM